MQHVLSSLTRPISVQPDAIADPVACDTRIASTTLALFGGEVPWNTSEIIWHSVDDRVRGGSSRSSLKLVDATRFNGSAIFEGHLDTKTLGGAGFASQSTISNNTEDDSTWDLSLYDGISILLGGGDAKKYTFTMKDEIPGKRSDGREKAGLSWEFIFYGPTKSANSCDESGSIEILARWDEFIPTYRGREQRKTRSLRLNHIKQFGLMMRSFFKEQEGDFYLNVKSVRAVKE